MLMEDRGRRDEEPETGEWENGENGRMGEWENGRMGEWGFRKASMGKNIWDIL